MQRISHWKISNPKCNVMSCVYVCVHTRTHHSPSFQGSGISLQKGQQECKIQKQLMATSEQCLDPAGQVHIYTDNSCDSVHRNCASTCQTKSQLLKKRIGQEASHLAMEQFAIVGFMKTEFSIKLYPLRS